MAKIYNSDLTRGLAHNAKIQESVDRTPNELAEKVVPVIETNPVLLREITLIKSSSALNNTGGSIFTTSSQKATYISNISLNWTKDAEATLTDVSIRVVLNGLNSYPVKLTGLTTTAETKAIATNFYPPIKVDKNTSVALTTVGGVAAGNVIWGYSLSYYEVDED